MKTFQFLFSYACNNKSKNFIPQLFLSQCAVMQRELSWQLNVTKCTRSESLAWHLQTSTPLLRVLIQKRGQQTTVMGHSAYHKNCLFLYIKFYQSYQTRPLMYRLRLLSHYNSRAEEPQRYVPQSLQYLLSGPLKKRSLVTPIKKRKWGFTRKKFLKSLDCSALTGNGMFFIPEVPAGWH